MPALLQWASAGTFAGAITAGDSAWSRHLVDMFRLEGLAVHGGIVFGIIWLLRPSSRRGLLLTAAALTALGVVYARAAFSTGGRIAVVELAGLALATYGGLLWSRGARRVAAGIEIGVRLFFAVLAMTVAVGVTGLPEDAADWPGRPASVLLAGSLFFALLGAVEASGLYVGIRRVGEEEAAKVGQGDHGQ